jgi:transposase
VRAVEQRIQATFKPTPAVQRLLTLPGVGLTLAVVIALEVGEVARFASAEKLAAYAGTTPRVHASGGKTRFGPSRPDVNRYLESFRGFPPRKGLCSTNLAQGMLGPRIPRRAP